MTISYKYNKTPSGDYVNMHTGVRSSKPPAKKKRGEKTWAEWDAIEKAKKEQGVAEGSKETKPKKPMTWQQAYAHNDGESFDARQKRITQYEKSKGEKKPKHVDWGKEDGMR